MGDVQAEQAHIRLSRDITILVKINAKSAGRSVPGEVDFILRKFYNGEFFWDTKPTSRRTKCKKTIP